MATLKIWLLLLFVATIDVALGHEKYVPIITNQIHLLRPQSGSGGSYVEGLSCLSWRLAVETNNLISWTQIPTSCVDYVGHYMLGSQYRQDSELVIEQALAHAKALNVSTDGTDIWVFDIDETALSNLPYYADTGFGSEPYNATKFNEWVETKAAPALPATLELYEALLNLGIKVVFITGRPESQRNVTSSNLKAVGYTTWEELVLKGSEYSGKTAVVYKSAQRKILENDGYRIVGNIGDQWSDLLGTNIGLRTFKLPDPMYYIG
ncbi:Acid phosphatase [Parasponia andersonii]|uniref:Acid phosphatase n=1 Tax=Parasponia andersonii TaxID=3476 RepID=A0A2P5C0F6_PARAD|nr:Acid phosphatase [Parasponia andersonii]